MLKEIQQVQQQARLLYTETQIEAALNSMAQAITQKLHDQNPLILCVINGGIIVTGQLLPKLNFPLTLDCAYATRYRNNTAGSDLQWQYKPATPLQQRNVLIIDDILDEGHTLQGIVDYCRLAGASSVHTAVLLDKNLGRAKPLAADFVGLPVDNHYLFGYGMDYKGYLRNAAGIFACKETS